MASILHTWYYDTDSDMVTILHVSYAAYGIQMLAILHARLNMNRTTDQLEIAQYER
jgi:hypothetical protein